MLFKIDSDEYNISKRIKDIDTGYFIVLNTSTSKFEVHNTEQLRETYCLTIPYKELDERTLNYVHKTKSVNIEQILDNIENHNKQRESAEKSSTLSTFYDNLEQLRR